MATIGSLSESNRGENVDKNVKEHLMDIDSRYRPDGWEQRMKGPRTIESLCEPWDGTKVWAVLDKGESLFPHKHTNTKHILHTHTKTHTLNMPF